VEGVRQEPAREGAQALKRAAAEFLLFGLKQARACVFAGSFMLVLAISHKVPLFGLARYDFILLAAVAIQAVLLLTRLETWDEARVIAVFHPVSSRSRACRSTRASCTRRSGATCARRGGSSTSSW
jgi:Protein of unknown function (DUF817)